MEVNLRGKTFYLHEQDALSSAIQKNQDYWESDILDYLRDNFLRQNTILDIGANIGNHSQYFARFLDASQIIAFEPIYDNFTLCSKNLQDFPNTACFELAISDHSGILGMSKNMDNYGAHEISLSGGEKVTAITVDSLLAHDVSLIKLDVEWHEPQVIAGAQETIKRCKPLILIEDANKVYSSLLPDYDLHMSWDHHRTYLYKWRE